MPKPKTEKATATSERSVPLFSRVSPTVAAKVMELAAAQRVSVSEFVRWILEDVANGKTMPSHLRRV